MPEYEITLIDKEWFELRINLQRMLIPCSMAGDIADGLNQIWLEYHSADLEEKETNE